MTAPKYLEERNRSGGRTAHVFNPPQYVQRLVPEARYKAFADRDDAVRHAKQMALKYELAKSEERAAVGDLTVAQLCSTYRDMAEYGDLGDTTKAGYRRGHELVMKALAPGRNNHRMATVKARAVDPVMATKVYRAVRDENTQSVASAAIIAMRQVWNVMITEGEVAENPWSHIRLPEAEARDVKWQDHHVAALVAAADAKGQHAFALLVLMTYHHGRRPGEVRKLVWSQIGTDTVAYYQDKTKSKVVPLPIMPEVQERLSRLTRGKAFDPVILRETTGKPFSTRDYNKVFEKLRKAAGLPEELQIRDLRRTAITEMIDSGATAGQAASVSGHKDHSVLARHYTVQTEEQAREALAKRFSGRLDTARCEKVAKRLSAAGYDVPVDVLAAALKD